MKILVADDDGIYRHMLQEVLETWGYEVITASNGNEALSILDDLEPPRIAIMDWVMPGMEGIDVCNKARKLTSGSYTYIIMVSSKNKLGDIITGLEAQADDYLTKPVDFEELRLRLESGRRIVELQSALNRNQLGFRNEDTHDSLTGLWNQAAIINIVSEEIARAEIEEQSLCVMLADIDHFKSVNDTFGHDAGDAVLTEVARRMMSSVRSSDFIGRYGGEEFILVLPGCNEPNAFKLFEKLRMHINETLHHILKTQISLSISIGASINTKGGNIIFLFRAANNALYQAKTNGCNCIRFADAEDLPIILPAI